MRALFVSVGLLLAGLLYPADAARAQTPGVLTDDDHDGIDDALEQRLAERFAPVVFIEPRESNYPVNVDWLLQRTHLEYHENCCRGLLCGDVDEGVGPSRLRTQADLIGPPWQRAPNCGEDDDEYGAPAHRPVTTTAADPDGLVAAGDATTGYAGHEDEQTFVLPDLSDGVGTTDPSEWVTYFHAYPTLHGGVMLQYWHLFAANDLSILGMGRHAGDWDASIQVELSRNLELKGVWFSRHVEDHPGTFLARDNPRLHLYDGTHPLMAIDGGGHAAYADLADFCDYRFTGPVSTSIAWPLDPSDPMNPESLRRYTAPPRFLGGWPSSPNQSGGVVWSTWTGGTVSSTRNLSHPLDAALSAAGPLVNLGEYNPCTPTTCNGSAQASSLLAGEFHPLNDQVFLRYSGRWGTLPSEVSLGFGVPPRGPVFQGFVDAGEGNVSSYTSWYNEGADSPAANDGDRPWRVPPTTWASISGANESSGVECVSGSTTVALEAMQSSVADAHGKAAAYFRVFPTGSPAPGGFQPYVGAITLTPGDGPFTIEYYSVDSLDNVEDRHTLDLTPETTAPDATRTLATTSATSARRVPSRHGRV